MLKLLKLHVVVKNCERRYIYQVLCRCHGDRTRTAKVLGIGLSTLYRKIKELQITVKRGDSH